RGVLRGRLRAGVPARRRGARQFFGPRAGARRAIRVRAPAAGAGRRRLLLSTTVGRQRLQAPEPVPAMDGAPRRGGSRRVDVDSSRQADCAARHPRDPSRALPAAHDLHVARLAHGGRHHRLAARDRSRGSRAVRLLALPRRHDERLRLRPPAGSGAMSVTRALPAALIGAFVVAAIAFAGGYMLGARRIVRFANAPAGNGVAYVLEGHCAAGLCQSLWIGTTVKAAKVVETLTGPSEQADEIAWTPDGGRVAFIVNGYQLRLFDARTGSNLGAMAIVDPDGFP